MDAIMSFVGSVGILAVGIVVRLLVFAAIVTVLAVPMKARNPLVLSVTHLPETMENKRGWRNRVATIL